MAINSIKLTKKNIDAVLKFLPIFQPKEFTPGEWDETHEYKKGILSFPAYNYNIKVDEFVETLYEEGFIIDFEWSRWQDQAEQFYSNPELLKTADIGILQKLLTTHILKERFCDGHLACMLRNGHIATILHKLKEIRKKMTDSQHETN